MENGELESLLRQAWRNLRYFHPSIATVIDEDEIEMVYTVPHPQMLDWWVEHTFFVAEAQETPETFVSTAIRSEYPTLHFFPGTSEVSLHFSHWRIDARGSLIVLDHLLNLVTTSQSMKFGDEGRHLVPSVEHLGRLKVPEIHLESSRNPLWRLPVEFLGKFPGVGLKYLGDPGKEPGGSRRVELRILPDETKALLARCRALGLTLTAAVHASIACAHFGSYPRQDLVRHYVTYMPADVRRRVGVPPRDAAASVNIGTVPVYASSNQSWREIAEDYLASIKTVNEPDFLHLLAERSEQWHALILNPQLRKPPPASEVALSSLGTIEDIVSHHHGTPFESKRLVAVRNVRVDIEVLTHQVQLICWTFRGELTMSFNYNEAYYTAELIGNFASDFKRILEKELQASVASKEKRCIGRPKCTRLTSH